MAYRVNVFDPARLGLGEWVQDALDTGGITYNHVYNVFICADVFRADLVRIVNKAIAHKKVDGGFIMGGLTKMDNNPCWKYRKINRAVGWVSITEVSDDFLGTI